MSKIDLFEKKLIEINSNELGQEILTRKINEQINTAFKILQFFGE